MSFMVVGASRFNNQFVLILSDIFYNITLLLYLKMHIINLSYSVLGNDIAYVCI